MIWAIHSLNSIIAIARAVIARKVNGSLVLSIFFTSSLIVLAICVFHWKLYIWAGSPLQREGPFSSVPVSVRAKFNCFHEDSSSLFTTLK